MGVTFPPRPHSLREQLFGQTMQYICNLPLADCLEQLQNKSERKSGFFSSKLRILITIFYEDRDTYSFIVERTIPSGRSQIRMILVGQLQRIDAQHTSIVMDSTQQRILRGVDEVLIITFVLLVWFAMLSLILIGWGMAPILVGFSALGVSVLSIAALLRHTVIWQERLWRELAIYAFQALPPG